MHSLLETEIKLEVGSAARLRRKLLDLGYGVAKRRRFERNTLYDTPDARLRKSNCLLRLRIVKGHHLLTLKGAPRRPSRFKVRAEWEVEIRNPASLKSIFESLGLHEVFRYEKYRTTYAVAGAPRHGIIELDETPIGNYVELEGPRLWIDRTAVALGFHTRDYIQESYARLYEVYCLERRIRPRNMVFRRRKT